MHTPGPWHADEDHCCIWGGEGDEKIRVAHTAMTDDYQADARLIAAAPDLLDALSLLVEEIDDPSRLMVVNDVGSFQLSIPAVLAAREAIAKATGGS